ncbi:sigma-70 family RNA polymerase sigma factor [Streptomyces sp. NPDC051940]|uniref:sigma-70 family RNA polymerase sigma factor n=1 Tax=Streptomyces sp. NPDC051940 TaxID=3155675 RepID=UPI003438C5DD
MDRSPAHPAQDDCVLAGLYARHGRALHADVLHWAGGDHQRAEDIVQETFLRAWQLGDALDTERAWPWLRRVARNLAISAHRRVAARPPETELPEEELPATGDEFDHALQRWLLSDALQRLRPEHRAVLAEVYFRRHTVAEAAQRLGIPPGTVKSRTYYALRALRLILEEQGVTEP